MLDFSSGMFIVIFSDFKSLIINWGRIAISFLIPVIDRLMRPSLNEDKKPLAMTEKQADDLVFGLTLNMTPAVVVKSRFELNGHFLAK